MTKLYVDEKRTSVILVSDTPIEDSCCKLSSAKVIDEWDGGMDIAAVWTYGPVESLSAVFRFSESKGFLGIHQLHYVAGGVATELYTGYQKLIEQGIITALEGEPEEAFGVTVRPAPSLVLAMATKPLSWQLDISQQTLVFNLQMEDVQEPIDLKILEVKPQPDKPGQYAVSWFINSPDFLFCTDVQTDEEFPNSAPKVVKHHPLRSAAGNARYWGNYQGVFVPLTEAQPVTDVCGDHIIVVTPKLLGLV